MHSQIPYTAAVAAQKLHGVYTPQNWRLGWRNSRPETASTTPISNLCTDAAGLVMLNGGCHSTSRGVWKGARCDDDDNNYGKQLEGLACCMQISRPTWLGAGALERSWQKKLKQQQICCILRGNALQVCRKCPKRQVEHSRGLMTAAN